MPKRVSTFIIPPEYVAARDAIQALLNALACVVEQFRGRSSSPALWHPNGTQQIPAAIETLEKFEKDAEDKVIPVHDSLEEVCLGETCLADQVITYSARFRDSAELVLSANHVKEHALQLWLTRTALDVDEYRSGLTPNRENQSGRTSGVEFELPWGRESGIDFEFRKAAKEQARQGRFRKRFRCELHDRSVWLDGKELANGLAPDVFAYFAELADQYPDPISFKRMQDRSSELKGVNQSRLKMKIPCALSHMVETIPNKGHVLRLPS